MPQGNFERIEYLLIMITSSVTGLAVNIIYTRRLINKRYTDRVT